MWIRNREGTACHDVSAFWVDHHSIRAAVGSSSDEYIIGKYATEEEAQRVLDWIFTQARENPGKGVDLGKLNINT